MGLVEGLLLGVVAHVLDAIGRGRVQHSARLHGGHVLLMHRPLLLLLLLHVQLRQLSVLCSLAAIRTPSTGTEPRQLNASTTECFGNGSCDNLVVIGESGNMNNRYEAQQSAEKRGHLKEDPRSSLVINSPLRATVEAAAAAAAAAASAALRGAGDGWRDDVEEAALTCSEPAAESPSTAASAAAEAATACAAAAGRCPVVSRRKCACQHTAPNVSIGMCRSLAQLIHCVNGMADLRNGARNIVSVTLPATCMAMCCAEVVVMSQILQ